MPFKKKSYCDCRKQVFKKKNLNKFFLDGSSINGFFVRSCLFSHLNAIFKWAFLLRFNYGGVFCICFPQPHTPLLML